MIAELAGTLIGGAIYAGMVYFMARMITHRDRKLLRRAVEANARLVEQVEADRQVMAGTRDALNRIIVATGPE